MKVFRFWFEFHKTLYDPQGSNWQLVNSDSRNDLAGKAITLTSEVPIHWLIYTTPSLNALTVDP